MLHPQTQALLASIEKNGIPPTHTLSVAEARRTYRDRRLTVQPEPPAVGCVLDLRAPGPLGPVSLRMYRPVSEAATGPLRRPVMVFFHGGGWVIGDLDTHDTLCRQDRKSVV